MLILSHPTGNQNMRQAALALLEGGLLGEVWTCLGWREDHPLMACLPQRLRSEAARRIFPHEFASRLRLRPWPELGRLLAMRLGWSALTAHESGPLSIDQVYRDLDRRVARRLADGDGCGISGVYAYEDGAAGSFRAARHFGLARLYDLPIGYWRAFDALCSEERDAEPAWADTLIGTLDSPAKRERKECELADATRILVASTYTARTLALHRGPLAPVVTVPYGAPPVHQGARSWSSDGPLRALFVGSLSQRKGISYLFQAIERLAPHVTLTVIGARTRPCAALDQALARHRHIPSLPHAGIHAEMRQHDVLLFPSLFEGFGLVITEAMSQGLPVITTPHTAGPDLIEHGVDGFIVPIRGVQAMGEALELLRGDRALLRHMGTAALATAARRQWQPHYRADLVRAVRGFRRRRRPGRRLPLNPCAMLPLARNHVLSPLDDGNPASARALARIRVVRLIMATYVLLIIEGALRKWALEPIQKPLFFIRDPLILAIYAVSWRHRLVPRSPLMALLIVLLVGFIFLAGLQVALVNLNPLVAIFGLRSYFLAVWLVPVMAAVMTRRDVMAFIRLTLVIAMPMAVLSFIQWRSPANSYINKEIGSGDVFTVMNGVVRTTGTFTFTAGFVCFTSSVIACVAAYGFSRGRSILLLLAGIAATATCLATCGSRAGFVSAATTLVTVVLSEFFRPIVRQRPLVYLAVIGLPLAFCVAFAVVFPDAIMLMIARNEAATKVSDPGADMVRTLLNGFLVLENAGPLGVGIGYGTNGGAMLGTGLQHITLTEIEFSRVVEECGMIMGLAYMMMRWGMCLWLFAHAVRCIRERDDAVPLMLLSFCATLLIIGQITMQGTVNGYGWIFAGLTMAAVATSRTVATGTADGGADAG